MSTQALDILKQYWGFDSFRPMQMDIIQSVLDGKDTLALLPTGGGKSICFQVPALCQEGVCLVISPLIALMKDQVYNLRKRNIKADAIYSGLHYRDIDRILDNAVHGDTKLLYLSPERLLSDLAIERIKRMNVSMIAVDEAHCISQWGYDFRPPYLRIAELREYLPKVPFIALTATATPEVVDDIQEKLEFEEGQVFQKSFKRDNLAYVVLKEEDKEHKLLNILYKVAGSSVVYVRNRKRTKQIALFLQKKGIAADFYHAGLSSDVRSQKQDKWINDSIRVMVSTNAFGMGIDKPDVRTVVHMEMPDSLEAYFQEAGRAGRDGHKAYATLLYNESDKYSLEKNCEISFPPIKEIKRVYQALGSYFQLAVGSGEGESFDFDIITFKDNFQLNLVTTYHALKILEQAGWIILTDSVFIPSSVKMTVGKQELYDYQLRNPKYEKILKAVIRSYEGIFHHFIKINEKQLAKFLKISDFEIIKALKNMHKDGVIIYRPKKDKPQIVFTQERADSHNLEIDRVLYSFRKKRQEDRVQKAVQYAEEAICRSKQLLEYFGEKSKDCGTCDVCLKRSSELLTDGDYERYMEKIKQVLRREKLSMNEMIDSFSPKRRAKVIKAIEYMLDEKKIDLVDDKLVWIGKK